MQYIQFQQLDASQIPSAPNGSVNLFVDSTNNVVSIKTMSGLTNNLAFGMFEFTKTEMDSLIATSGLTAGGFYKITGVNTGLYGGTNIILQATSTYALSKSGWGEFYNPKYYDNQHNLPNTYYVWDNTIRLQFTGTTGLFNYGDWLIINNGGSNVYGNLYSNIGQNYLTLVPDSQNTINFLANPANYPLTITSDNTGAVANISAINYVTTYTAGTKVIWGNKVWVNITGANGNATNPLTLDSTNWTVVPYSASDYNVVWDIIEYEYEYDNISYRKDATNEVKCDHAFMWDYESNNIIAYFPWGNYWVNNITLKNAYTQTLVNFPNYNNRMSYVTVNDYAEFDCDYNNYFNGHTWGRGTTIINVTIDTFSYVRFNLGYNNYLNNINIEEACSINNVYTYDNENNYIQIHELTLSNQSHFDGDDYPIFMYSNSQISNVTLNNRSYFTGVIMYPNSNIRYLTLDNNSQFDNIHLGSGTYVSRLNLNNNSNFVGIYTDINVEVSNITLMGSYLGNNIQLNTGSTINNIQLGSDSYINNISLGYNSNFQDISVGVDSYITNINTSTGASINNISLGVDSNISSLTLNNYAYIRDINVDTFGGFGGLVLGDNTYVRRMQLGVDAGFGDITLITGSSLSDIEIGNTMGFGGLTLTANTYNKTVSRNFNNWDTSIVSSGSTNISYVPTNYQNLSTELDLSRTYQYIDITDQTQTLSWYLPDGNFEGQEMTFILKQTSGATILSTQVWVFVNALRDGMGLIVNSVPWYPFASGPLGRAIWLDGAWNIYPVNFD